MFQPSLLSQSIAAFSRCTIERSLAISSCTIELGVLLFIWSLQFYAYCSFSLAIRSLFGQTSLINNYDQNRQHTNKECVNY